MGGLPRISANPTSSPGPWALALGAEATSEWVPIEGSSSGPLEYGDHKLHQHWMRNRDWKATRRNQQRSLFKEETISSGESCRHVSSGLCCILRRLF